MICLVKRVYCVDKTMHEQAPRVSPSSHDPDVTSLPLCRVVHGFNSFQSPQGESLES